MPKIARTKHVITGSLHQTNKHFVLKLISFNSGNYKPATGQLQNTGNYKITPLTVQCQLLYNFLKCTGREGLTNGRRLLKKQQIWKIKDIYFHF